MNTRLKDDQQKNTLFEQKKITNPEIKLFL
jgi:hypothetical protein